ncbi:MAG: hypothetical protein DSY91_04710 [Deltaproteobacteria bacterium]|nr:MAG: hypothetical protein DSY91_04710 [Deltaproteobacteria bacterium]
MKILLHICCANCAVYPLVRLRDEGHEVYGFFFNPNIHPFQEYEKRLQAVHLLEERYSLHVIYRDEYRLDEFLRNVAFRESLRCHTCYHTRLLATAQVAKRGKFDAFTSSLLYSKQQQHGLAREIGEGLSHEKGVPFYYEDFRKGWKKGIELSLDEGFYRQQYCGCIYSERDRFLGKNRITRRKPRG